MTLPTGYTEVKVPLILFSLTPDPLPLLYDLQTLFHSVHFHKNRNLFSRNHKKRKKKLFSGATKRRLFIN